MELTDLYFAYGGDMDRDRLRALAGEVEVVAPACLVGYRMAFFGYDPIWDSGTETLVEDKQSEIWGVLYRLRVFEWDRLDSIRGATLAGVGAYFHYPLEVTTAAGEAFMVRTYRIAEHGAPRLPSREYLAFLAASAQAHGVPSAYQEALRALPSMPASYPVPRRDPAQRKRLHLL